MNSVATNLKNTVVNSANAARNLVRTTSDQVIETRSSVFYYALILALFIVLGLLSYFYQPIKSYIEDTISYVKHLLVPEPVSAPGTPPLSPEDRPSGTPGATESNSIAQMGASIPAREEVFHISKNIYTYSDAAAVCKAMNAELATEAQVNDAFKKGADWCSYGWVKGQLAVYPTQQSTFDSLQKGSPEQRTSCGKVGLNGGYFDNPDLRFGVTCYGMKPDSAKTNSLTHSEVELPLSTEELEFQKKVQKFRDQQDSTTVDPWNRSQWSS